jgi:L-ascorbate metabolism protein UlaG (beta-lactamase superfamily)
MKRLLQYLVIATLSATAAGQERSSVQYLANEGVMITHGETSILFDPLFDNSYGTYQMVQIGRAHV